MQGSSIWGFVIVVIGLAYLIIYLTNKPIKSKPGQKEKLYHGPVVSSRWKEKKDRQYMIGFLWFLLIMFVLALCQSNN